MTVIGLFNTCSIDFAGPLKETVVGNKYIVLVVENLPKWARANAITTNYFDSNGVTKFVEEQICQLYKNPMQILSDGGPKFVRTEIRDYASDGSINSKIVPAYNPRWNGEVERMVGTLKRAVQKVMISNKDGDC